MFDRFLKSSTSYWLTTNILLSANFFFWLTKNLLTFWFLSPSSWDLFVSGTFHMRVLQHLTPETSLLMAVADLYNVELLDYFVVETSLIILELIQQFAA